jgi:hypothetical protein
MSVYGLLIIASTLLMADMARLHTYIRPLQLAYVDVTRRQSLAIINWKISRAASGRKQKLIALGKVFFERLLCTEQRTVTKCERA